MKHSKRSFTVLAAAALLATGGAVTAVADEVAPVLRISCPTVAAMNRAIAPHLGPTDTLDATPTRCVYSGPVDGGGRERIVGVSTNAGTLPPVTGNCFPEGYMYQMPKQAVPSLGSGAYWCADASPVLLWWQLTPGTVGFLVAEHDESAIAAAKLIRPMMEVYTVPGTRTVNGRQWRTTCENYSSTARCRTEIWATVITRTPAGSYKRTDGWAFNSLTYRWSPRPIWKHNPLGAYGVVGGTTTWTSAEGRQWKTICDTSATGRGACRSYLMTTVISFSDGHFTSGSQWVFNNQVLFE
ncbi:hypothetical protein SAMN02745244_01730 [Tessaracoccus bendigoensis DSM 12906]|uniref:Uncharacterized protein n=1 Tax=Tessaracoccus bendigoensis DSM 12906 TaxID=1123357 RepID=A0A1M6GLA2_9ACTN|nr:hypothetical protein [Tessaracoccus bendigoensis]SHJ10646.1 hypothetical protein SAMN02745244_01730 [Tessaracoccus bendigoensis DSM 12906]